MAEPNDDLASQAVTLVTPPRGSPTASDVALSVDDKLASRQSIDRYVGATLENRYVVEQPLGEGGMGVVYRGLHVLIDKRVAIKILRGDLAADREMTERFLNEAKAASAIGNPHIVDISDFGRLPDGSAFFVMEFLDGRSLGALVKESRVTAIPRIVHIAKQIARGLSAAHSRGIVHRDLKPDNVMLIQRGEDADFVKVLDFGIAKVGGESGKITRAGSVFGTPHYMSPEQAAGVPVDQRTDIYSLGVILYELAAGRVPFDADSFMGILTQHMYKSPAPIRAIVPQLQEVPPGFEAVVLKCLSKKVELRYQTMDELVRDLEKVEAGQVPDAVSEMMARSGGFNVPADYFRNPPHLRAGMVPGTPSLPRRKPVLVGVLLGVAISVFVVGGGVAYSLRASADESANDDATPVPSGATAVVSVASATTAPASAKIDVLVTTEPVEALVAIDGDPTDKPRPQPRTLLVGADEKLSVRIEAKGYKPKTVPVDLATLGKDAPRLVVKLDPIAAVRPAVQTRHQPAPKASATAATGRTDWKVVIPD